MYNLDKVKILIVDDEELLREILVETFDMHGAEVDSAEGGDAAFDKIKSKKYDVVITDVRMPNGDGISLINRINLMDQSMRPKIFVCSAYNDLTEQKIADLNIVKLFNKPFDLEKLLKDVSNVIASL